MPTVKETFDLMPTKFKPANAAGVNKTIQYEIGSRAKLEEMLAEEEDVFSQSLMEKAGLEKPRAPRD